MLHLALQPEKYLGKSPKQNRRQLHTKLPTWQRICIVAYALFWGFGLPFICFGAIAEPGHPHALPHFVFADPIDSESSNLAVRAMQLAGSNDVVSKFYDQYLKPLTSTTSTDRSAGTNAGIPAGRAESSLAIFNLFTLMLLCVWAISCTERRYAVFLQAQPFPESIVISLPLPPPRLAALSH